MSEEIKKILKYMKQKQYISGTHINYGYKTLGTCQVELLLDHITNLQQKVEQLEKENEYLDNELNNMTDYAKDLENIRKEAIESIERGYVVFCEQDEECLLNFRKNMLNILNKGSENSDS